MTFSVKHSMPAGDLLSVLPGIRQIYRETGKKAIIYQRVNLSYGDVMGAYRGATYSIKDENNIPVTMNRPVFEALESLLRVQEYIEGFVEWDGQVVDIDLDLLRSYETTMPYGSIARYPFYIFPEMSCDLSEKFLDVEDVPFPGINLFDKILINRTERYTNMLISYTFLRRYADKVLFVGLPHEHKVFCDHHKLDLPLFSVNNFYELASAIKMCRLFIGNQSMCFQIAEGVKGTRLLEVCKPIPNVVGCGKGFYDFLHQEALEHLVHKLYHQ